MHIFQFTQKEFLAQVMNMRELMGNREFWAKDSETRQKAINGFNHCYLNAGPLDKNMISYYVSTMKEYTLREGMIEIAGLLGK